MKTNRLLILSAAMLLCGCVTKKPVFVPVSNTPPPIIRTPRENIPPQEPSTPLTIAAMLPNANKLVTHASLAGPVRSNAHVILHWNIPKDFATGYHIWNTNGEKVMTVAREFNNCTVTNLLPGQVGTFYSTAFIRVPVSISLNPFGVTWNEIENGYSNTNGATAAVPPKGFYLSPQPYSFAWTWRCAPGVTNALQFTTNLTNWHTLASFIGTNGTARIETTNSLPEQYFRVALLNATNPPPVLTNGLAKVRLEWQGDGREKMIEGLADPATGSYVTLTTNSQTGQVSLVTADVRARYRMLHR